MRSLPRLLPERLSSVRSPELALAVFGAFLSYACSGCLSNEYVIPRAELARIAQLPPEQRGQRVRVVQDLGDRRADAIDTTQSPPAPGYEQGGPPAGAPEGYVEGGVEPGEPHVGFGVIIAPGPPFPLGPPLPPGPHNLITGTGAGPRAVGAGPLGRSAPLSRGTAPRGSKVPGGKLGGGSGKDDLVALIIVVAVLATVGMITTEGTRYDGHVAIYAWQPVHLQDASGQEREVPLAQLTPADASAASKAKIMDDEGWGMLRLGRGPLDRQGFAFRMDIGGFHSSNSNLAGDGMGFGLQVGYFPHHRVGVLAGWSIAGGSDSAGKAFTRNNLAVEAQVFPVGVWRLHLGGFGHAGIQYADDADAGTRNGTALGGGLLLEIGLTARLALTLRADYTSAKIGPNQGWQAGELFTAGVAIY